MFTGLPDPQENIVAIRRWTAAMSFTLQAALIAVAFIYPLFHPKMLPQVFHPLFVPIFGDQTPTRPTRSLSQGGAPLTARPIVVTRRAFSFSPGSHPTPGSDVPAAPNVGDLGSGSAAGVWQSVEANYARPLPPVASQPRNVKHSVVMEGNLIHKVEPQYPIIAKQIGIQGAVLVKAWISTDGRIERATVERGQPLLAQAALDAVRQWKYRPYYLNGEAIEVETEITVNFVLQR